MTAPLVEDTQYPRRWQDYIGQQQAKETLRVAAQSARLRRQRLDHVLIANPEAGVGKTALAMLIGAELKRDVRVISGEMNDQQARWFFADLDEHTVVVYDEFHRLFEGSKKSWGWILNFMQDSAILGPMGWEDMPPVTLVATTTEPTSLPDPVASRFFIRPQLVPYTNDEAARIAQKMAISVLEDLPPLGRKDALAVAFGANNNPRAIRQLLTVLRDLTVTETLTHNGRYDVAGLLKWEGITEDGLDRLAQRYLVALATELGGHAGERAMAERLQQAGGLASVERLLMDRGLVARTRTGRMLTKDGIVRTQQLLKEGS